MAVAVTTADGRELLLGAEFASSSALIRSMLLDSDGDADAIPLPITAEDLSVLVDLTAQAAGAGTEAAVASIFAKRPPGALPSCIRAAAFLGLPDATDMAVRHLAGSLAGRPVADMRAACGHGAEDPADSLSEAQQELLSVALREPTAERIRGVTAALRGPPSERDGGSPMDEDGVLGLDYDTSLELLRALSLRDVRTLLQASHAACALLFAPAAGAKHRFRAWQAVLQGRHPALESLEFDALEEVEAPSAAATDDDDDDGDDGDDKWSERTSRMCDTMNIVSLLSGTEEDHAAIFDWLRSNLQLLLQDGNGGGGRRSSHSTPPGLLAASVYRLSTTRAPSTMSAELYGLAMEAAAAAAAAAASRIDAAVPTGPAGSEPGQAELVELVDQEWLRLVVVHNQLCTAFEYLERYFIKKENLQTVAAACEAARDSCSAFVQARSRGWAPPLNAAGDTLQQREQQQQQHPGQQVLLVFSADDTILVTARDLHGCDALLAQVRAAEPTQIDRPVPLTLGSQGGGLGMLKLLTFTRRMGEIHHAGATVASGGGGGGGGATASVAEQGRALLADWCQTLNSQEALPVLFQTMTVANQVGNSVVLDALCKMVAEIIAGKSPSEIHDYFNIRKDATWEEEQELIATHPWIDPDGLIARDRATRLRNRARQQQQEHGGGEHDVQQEQLGPPPPAAAAAPPLPNPPRQGPQGVEDDDPQEEEQEDDETI
jgi:hypothetical protein